MKEYYRRFTIVTRCIEDGLLVLAGILLVTMMMIISINSLLRFLFGFSFAWTFELAGYMLFTLTFLSSPWVLRHDGHIEFDLLVDQLKGKKKKIQKVLVCIICIVFTFLLFIYGFEIALDNYQRNIINYNVLAVPKYLLLMMIPICGFLMFFEYIRKLVQTLSMNKK